MIVRERGREGEGEKKWGRRKRRKERSEGERKEEEV